MINETILTSILLVILIGAVGIYLYSYIAYLEKKVGMIESLTVDMRMALDTLMTENQVQPGMAAVPISGGAIPMPPQPLPQLPTEQAPEESFYSSVLSQAHESVPAAEPAQGPGVSLEAALATFEAAGAGEASSHPAEEAPLAPAPAPAAPAPAVGPNYDGMTRAELTSLAEQRGLRVKKSMSRSEIISLLRRLTPVEIQPQATGTENVSGSAGVEFQAGASLDESAPVDSGLDGEAISVE